MVDISSLLLSAGVLLAAGVCFVVAVFEWVAKSGEKDEPNPETLKAEAVGHE